MTEPERKKRADTDVGPSVFISYSRKDQAFARRLGNSLESGDYDVYIDQESIAAAGPWREELQRGIENADDVVFVLSPDFVASEECARELQHARENEKRLIPVLWRQTRLEHVPSPLVALNFIDFRVASEYQDALRSLEDAITFDLDWVRTHTRIQVRALEWDRGNRNRSFLLRGADLGYAERWLDEAPGSDKLRPTALQNGYILSSRRAANQRRLLMGLAASVIALAAIIAWWQYEVRLEQQSLALVADSYRNLYRTPLLSLDKALRARDLHPGEAAQTALRVAQRVAVLRAVNLEEQGKITGVGAGYLAGRFREGFVFSKLSPDGQHVLLTTERGIDGPKPPGEVYLLDNESLHSVELVARVGDGRRLEFAGFTRSGAEVLISRQFHIEIYALDGQWKWGREVGYHAKPISFGSRLHWR